jgi:hypothetical protein
MFRLRQASVGLFLWALALDVAGECETHDRRDGSVVSVRDRGELVAPRPIDERAQRHRVGCRFSATACWLIGLDLVTVFGFVPRGRAPTAKERAQARPPYHSTGERRERERRQVADDELADKAAIELARRNNSASPPT